MAIYLGIGRTQGVIEINLLNDHGGFYMVSILIVQQARERAHLFSRVLNI